jgi:hypothetical protein
MRKRRLLLVATVAAVLTAVALVAGRGQVIAAVDAALASPGTTVEQTCSPTDAQYDNDCGAGPHCTIAFVRFLSFGPDRAGGTFETVQDPSTLGTWAHPRDTLKVAFSDCHGSSQITYEIIDFRDGVEFSRFGPQEMTLPANPNSVGLSPGDAEVGHVLSFDVLLFNETGWQIVHAPLGLVTEYPSP